MVATGGSRYGKNGWFGQWFKPATQPTINDPTRMTTIEWTAVRSRAIAAVGYDGRTLSIEFTSGRVYDHPNVPPSVYRELMRASSKGSYYNANIRGKYR
jgi:hypothetical protein